MNFYFKKAFLKYKKIIIYLIFGALATVVNILTKYLLLFTFLEASNAIQLQFAIILSWIVAVLFAYFTNRTFVFESKNSKIIKEFISFVVARIFTLLLEMLIMWFFITLLKLNSNIYIFIFTLISQILVILGNYLLSKLFIFKKMD